CKWAYFDDIVLHVAADLFGVHEVVERVEKGAEVGVDLGDHVAGQVAEALAGLDGGADEDDLLDDALAEPAYGHSDCQIGLARAGWPYTKGQVVLAHGADVAALAVGARPDVAAGGCCALGGYGGVGGDALAALGDDLQDGLDVLRGQAALL